MSLNVWEQGNPYWPMIHSHSYKYGFLGSASNSSHSLNHAYDLNDLHPRFDEVECQWDNSSLPNIEESPSLVSHESVGDADSGASPVSEDCKSISFCKSSE